MKVALGKIMPVKLKYFYEQEIFRANELSASKNYLKCWHHLERAHILAQPYAIEHTIVHWKMFCFGCKIKNTKEIIGQLPRLLFGGIKSFVGKVPVGNTGGANVPPLRSMEIPPDLKLIIEQANK